VCVCVWVEGFVSRPPPHHEFMTTVFTINYNMLYTRRIMTSTIVILYSKKKLLSRVM